MCLTAYIFIVWRELHENPVSGWGSEQIQYAMLAILGLYAASVKLSAGVLFLFIIEPLIELLRQKKYRDLCCLFLICVIIIQPFIMRNLLISGYCLYPVSSIDFFDFDWKIPKSVIVSDDIMIRVYARASGTGYDYYDWEKSFVEWIPLWIKKTEPYFDVLGVINLVLAVPIICYNFINVVKTKKFSYEQMVLLMSIVGFLFLLFSAPSTRFGRWYYISAPVILLYILIYNLPM